MMAVSAILLCFAGYTALALSLGKHHREAVGSIALTSQRTTWLRAGGWSLLLLALQVLAIGRTWPIALIFWCGIATIGVSGVALLLTYRPAFVLRAGLIALPLSLCALMAEGFR